MTGFISIIFSLKSFKNLSFVFNLLCSPVFVPQILGGAASPVAGPVTVKVSVLKISVNWINRFCGMELHRIQTGAEFLNSPIYLQTLCLNRICFAICWGKNSTNCPCLGNRWCRWSGHNELEEIKSHLEIKFWMALKFRKSLLTKTI